MSDHQQSEGGAPSLADATSTGTALAKLLHRQDLSALLSTAALLLAVFGSDLVVRLNSASSAGIGIFYFLPGFAALSLRGRRAPQVVAGCATALILLSIGITAGSGIPIAIPQDAIHVAVSLFAVWITASLASWRQSEEQRLEDERRMMTTTLESIADAVITTDAKERIVYMNPSAANKTGWSAQVAAGRHLHEVFRAHDEEPSEDDQTPSPLPEKDGVPHEAVLETRVGDAMPIETTSALIRDTDPDHLGRRRGRVLVFRDISERKRQQEAVERLAYSDQLTGLPNRAAFFERLDLELAHARRDSSQVALLFIDLDGFKAINDNHGHRAGDYLLKVVARRLRDSLREVDTVARLAGDEFTVILPKISSLEDAHLVAQKLMLAVADPVDIVSNRVRVTPSVGIAMYPDDALDRDDLLQRADQAMYRSKADGGFQAKAWEGAKKQREKIVRGTKGRPAPRKS